MIWRKHDGCGFKHWSKSQLISIIHYLSQLNIIVNYSRYRCCPVNLHEPPIIAINGKNVLLQTIPKAHLFNGSQKSIEAHCLCNQCVEHHFCCTLDKLQVKLCSLEYWNLIGQLWQWTVRCFCIINIEPYVSLLFMETSLLLSSLRSLSLLWNWPWRSSF